MSRSTFLIAGSEGAKPRGLDSGDGVFDCAGWRRPPGVVAGRWVGGRSDSRPEQVVWHHPGRVNVAITVRASGNERSTERGPGTGHRSCQPHAEPGGKPLAALWAKTEVGRRTTLPIAAGDHLCQITGGHEILGQGHIHSAARDQRARICIRDRSTLSRTLETQTAPFAARRIPRHAGVRSGSMPGAGLVMA
jgi:hypothetical protein